MKAQPRTASPAGALLLALAACQTTAPTAQDAADPGDCPAGSAGPAYCETVLSEPRRHGAVEPALLARRQVLNRPRRAALVGRRAAIVTCPAAHAACPGVTRMAR